MFCPKKICSKKIAHSWPYLKTNFHQKAPFSSIISLFHRSILHYKMKHLESLTFHYRTCISKCSSKMAASQGRSQPHNPRCRQEFHFPHFSSKFPSFFSLIFPQTFLIFVLILALWVGESTTQRAKMRPWLCHCSQSSVERKLEYLQPV